MTLRDEIANEYFEWMYNIACGKRYSKQVSYRKLLMHLHNAEFTYSIPRDENRAEDGIDLRYRFSLLKGYDATKYLDDPCSVLEMMMALSIRCEECIMDDPSMGDRTGQWFWGMVVNLGLGAMTDDRFDRELADEAICRLLNREYEPDGRGGLFTVKNSGRDLRTVEIWHQLCWYLDNIV